MISATAVKKSNLHTRIALKVILITGTSPKRLMFGLMLTTAVLSMLISNVASVALMIPIVNAALEQLTEFDEMYNDDGESQKLFQKKLIYFLLFQVEKNVCVR